MVVGLHDGKATASNKSLTKPAANLEVNSAAKPKANVIQKSKIN